jgi:RimJ/RimL family protein N-acetyltransferase
MAYTIRPLTRKDVDAFLAHFDAHRAESGRGDWHFMPFEPGDADGPLGCDIKRLDKPLTAPGWQRWFIAVADDDRIVGHVDLKSSALKTSRHRCLLGIGIERPHRQKGLGRRLMETAIRFARDAESIEWIDLTVFAHNEPARALYRSLGFEEIGTIADRFRIESDTIDDVVMALRVV